jgi:hypothetical protein
MRPNRRGLAAALATCRSHLGARMPPRQVWLFFATLVLLSLVFAGSLDALL